jgi:hypothetical protein
MQLKTGLHLLALPIYIYSLVKDHIKITVSSVVSSLSVAVETWLPCCCLAAATSSCSTIPAFSHHITIVACRPVAGQQLQDKQMYNSPLLSNSFANKQFHYNSWMQQ